MGKGGDLAFGYCEVTSPGEVMGTWRCCSARGAG